MSIYSDIRKIYIKKIHFLETCKQAQTAGSKSTCFKKCERIMQSGKILM